jgi:hypothetical protein
LYPSPTKYPIKKKIQNQKPKVIVMIYTMSSIKDRVLYSSGYCTYNCTTLHHRPGRQGAREARTKGRSRVANKRAKQNSAASCITTTVAIPSTSCFLRFVFFFSISASCASSLSLFSDSFFTLSVFPAPFSCFPAAKELQNSGAAAAAAAHGIPTVR